MSDHEKKLWVNEWWEQSNEQNSISENAVTTIAWDVVSILEQWGQYTFTEELSYEELNKITCNLRQWTNTEVEELLKNDVIKEAYVIWSSVRLTVKEGNLNAFPCVQLKEVDTTQDVEMDYENKISMWMSNLSESFFYPQNILVFSERHYGFEVYTQKWLYISYSKMSSDIQEACLNAMRSLGVKELEVGLIWDEWTQILLDKGIQINLKQEGESEMWDTAKDDMYLQRRKKIQFDYHTTISSWNEDDLMKLVNQTQQEYQWGFSDGLFTSTHISNYIIEKRWILFWYFSAHNIDFRDSEIDAYFESEMKKRDVTNDQLAKFICSKVMRNWDYSDMYTPNDQKQDRVPSFEARKAVLDKHLDKFSQTAKNLGN